MAQKTELCGFQPTGRSEDVPKPPKYNLNAEFWRTQWSEASGAHLMEYLRAEKLKKDNEILKKALTEIAEIINDDIHECDYSCDNDCELDGSLNMYSVENLKSVTESALAEIGDEGSGDE